MGKATFWETLDATDLATPHSTLTINHPSAGVGLMNLLELVEHRIEHEDTRTIHSLTFISGRQLRIVAHERCVTVEGERISFHPSEVYPFHTLLSDP